MIEEICLYTNEYAWAHITNKQSYAEKDGSWKEIKPDEFKVLLTLIIYFGLVKVNKIEDCWSTRSLYNGLWARNIISNRERIVMAMIHVVDFSTQDENDRLRKVRGFTEQMRYRCKELYRPSQNVAILHVHRFRLSGSSCNVICFISMKTPSLFLAFTPVFIHTISLFHFGIHLGINIIKSCYKLCTLYGNR